MGGGFGLRPFSLLHGDCFIFIGLLLLVYFYWSTFVAWWVGPIRLLLGCFRLKAR